MKYSLLYIPLLLSILFTGMAVAESFTKTMEEGEEGTFPVGDRSYAIEVMIIEDATPATVTFNINGQITPQMIEHEQFRLRDGILLTITDILLNEAGEAGSGDIVTFTLTEYCGDNICSAVENCGSCARDCGCQEGFFCKNDLSCEAIECGDDICSPTESCAEDRCCDGKQMNLVTNNANCGQCGTICKRSEQCIDSVCTSKEKPKEPVKQQPAKKVIEKPKDLDQCKITSQCDDKNPCTIDNCQGTPKQCSSSQQQGCVQGTTCLPQTTTIILDGVSSFCSTANSLESQKDEGTVCQADYECLSTMCKEERCYVERPTLWESLLSWFGFTTA